MLTTTCNLSPQPKEIFKNNEENLFLIQDETKKSFSFCGCSKSFSQHQWTITYNGKPTNVNFVFFFSLSKIIQ